MPTVRAAIDEEISAIERRSAPERMTKDEALEFLEAVKDHVDSAIDALKDEIASADDADEEEDEGEEEEV